VALQRFAMDTGRACDGSQGQPAVSHPHQDGPHSRVSFRLANGNSLRLWREVQWLRTSLSHRRRWNPLEHRNRLEHRIVDYILG